MGQINGVLHDMDFVFEFGGDVDGGVGDEQGAGVGRRIHNKNVGDAAGGAQPCIAVHGRLHQFIGVQAPFIMARALPEAAHATPSSAGFVPLSA